ncbi:MAG: betaine/proline/choline family ABC transporter ATP-binding protein [Halobacteriovoraceae bacterium]|nr:betaine/proline/choline family ABC transporter ATP-binding protein [Halobacteriovoraceae bacterium]MCB9095362.1 betaine/proline/choline family ABC transporter ATP-binding protein [Halobacteriovoraceae bacterium]
MSDVVFKNIYKIFGDKELKAMELLRKGKTKKKLLEDDKLVVGINNISLKIKNNEFFVIMGLSGSGKSTLIRHLNGLIKPTAGKVLVDKQDVTCLKGQELLNFRRHKVSMVFQKFGLLPHKNVLENVYYGLKIRGESKEECLKKANKWIEVVGLSGYEKSYPAELSGGMQQRVGLARALATETDILVMDEPFSALDPLIRAEMQNVTLDLKEKMKKTVIFVTHDLDEAIKLADRMAILKDGELIQVGTPSEIISNPADEYVKSFVGKDK